MPIDDCHDIIDSTTHLIDYIEEHTDDFPQYVKDNILLSLLVNLLSKRFHPEWNKIGIFLEQVIHGIEISFEMNEGKGEEDE